MFINLRLSTFILPQNIIYRPAEAEDDPAAEMFGDVRNSQAKSSEDVEDSGSPISSLISFDKIFSMPKFDE